jgi:[histone H3]-lysine27 N-trimethyltransferase EZH2
MRRNRLLLVGKSTVPSAGWGLFTMLALTKGDFIQEYLGELLTEDEGERRGLLCDQRGCSYMFTQSSDFDIDGLFKGSKVRFSNHSKTPNIETKRLFVNGDLRIGFFANQDIAAQSEVSIYLFLGFGLFSPRLIRLKPNCCNWLLALRQLRQKLQVYLEEEGIT